MENDSETITTEAMQTISLQNLETENEMCNNQIQYLQHRSHFKVRFEPGTCVVDDELAVVGIIPRFDASVHVMYSSVFVLPSETSVVFLFISEPCLNGC